MVDKRLPPIAGPDFNLAGPDLTHADILAGVAAHAFACGLMLAGEPRWRVNQLSHYLPRYVRSSAIPGTMDVHGDTILGAFKQIAPFYFDRPEENFELEDLVQDRTVTCLECRENVAYLKSHLRKAHKLTPEKYIAKWRLPADMPMTGHVTRREKQKVILDAGISGAVAHQMAKKKRQR